MNFFAPQCEQSKIELEQLADIKNHIISPKDSKPIVALKQDSLIGSYKFTSDITTVRWKDAMNLLAGTKVVNELLEKPFAKGKMYSGKEIYSYLIPDKVNVKTKTVEIKNGEILKGPLAKKELGSAKNNISHLIIDSYDKFKSAQFMDNVQRMMNNWLMSINGFCVGLGDVVAPKEVSDEFKKYNETKMLEILNLYTENENNHLIDTTTFEEIIFRELTNVMSTHAKNLMGKLDINNNMYVMLESGSKGKDINLGMIMGCIGQCAYGNKLLEKRFNNRTLAHFAKHDDHPSARGFIKNPFINGSKGTEFFFHQMDGRVGLIDTAIKSVTGDTELVIIENNESKCIRIGDWIDAKLLEGEFTTDNSKDELREELKLKEKVFIPTVDLHGRTSWGEVTGITRHLPSKTLFKIKTMSGREVTVTDSHSLLIWNKETAQFDRISPKEVVLGDLVPVNVELGEPQCVISHYKDLTLNNTSGSLIGFYLLFGRVQEDRIVIEYKDPYIRSLFKKFEVPVTENSVAIIAKSAFLANVLKDLTLDKLLNAPIDFLKGLLNIIISFNGKIVKNKLELENFVGLLNVLEHFGIFGQIKDNKVIISDAWLKIIQSEFNLISYDIQKKINSLTLPSRSTLKHYQNVILDKITEVIEIEPNVTKVYDITVPSTMNFCLANGLGVVDTADTGYMQKKTIKATEDIYLAYDNTVRNSINGIVQFIYGDNGYDTSKQIQVRSNLISMNNDKLKETYEFTKSELKSFPFSKNKEYVAEMFRLRDYLRQLQIKIHLTSKKVEENYNLPFNIERIINYHIHKERKGKSKITPSEIVSVLEDYLTNSKTKLMTTNSTTTLKVINEQKHKFLLRTLIHEYLAPKRILLEYKLDKDTFYDIMHDLTYSFNKNQASSCEMVGIIAAQSIGEPLTQFTLNTFHSTGVADVTAGMSEMVRIKELISFSKNIKTSYMKIYLDESIKYNEERVKAISNVLENTMLEDITIAKEIYFEPDYTTSNSIHNKDNLTNNTKEMFFSSSSSKNTSLKSLPWVYRFILDKEKLFTKQITLLDIKTQFIKLWNTTSTELKGFKKKERELINLISNICILSNDEDQDQPIIHIRVDFKEYDYQYLLDLLGLISSIFKIKGIKGIEKTFVSKELEKTFDKDGNLVEKTEYIIMTKGVNFDDIFYYDIIDTQRTICNDVVLLHTIYGIEATRALLLKELSDIFYSKGQDINYQHLSIIVDIMTQNGAVTSLNRYGINKLETDPLSRASFEKTIEQLIQAAIFQEKDRINSVSSRIIAGRAINGGTGMVNLLLDTDKLENTEFIETENDTIGVLSEDPFIKEIFS
jgi:DNA-directed RNA polymerase beta' subunit